MVGLLPAPKQFRQDKKHTNRTAMIRFSCTLCRVSVFHKYLHILNDDIFHSKQC